MIEPLELPIVPAFFVESYLESLGPNCFDYITLSGKKLDQITIAWLDVCLKYWLEDGSLGK